MSTEGASEGLLSQEVDYRTPYAPSCKQSLNQTTTPGYSTTQVTIEHPKNIQETISQIFDHKYISLIRGCKADIRTLESQRQWLKQRKRQRKFGMVGYFLCSALCWLFALILLIVMVILMSDRNNNGSGGDLIKALIPACALGICCCAMGIRNARLNDSDLWNQDREIRLFKFDTDSNEIMYQEWKYSYGIHPNGLHEPTISMITNEKICTLNQLIRITKFKAGNNAQSWIRFHFQLQEHGVMEKYEYKFESMNSWGENTKCTAYGTHKPNLLNTYKDIKRCLDELKPGWQNPNAREYRKIIKNI